tara:strand:- start:662 stop:856 length:195 start_codon:yes stop_codon:yes gene_type:complete
MFDIILIALGTVVTLGMAFTIALLWGLHSIGVKNLDWNWTAGFSNLTDDKPKTESVSQNTDFKC